MSWSDIPLELAGLVLHHLPAQVDRVRFAAVCRQWCRARREIHLPPPLPLLALPEGTVYSFPGSGEPLRFPACAGYTDACGNWLLFSGLDGYFLRNPFSNATVKLPGRFRVLTQQPFGAIGPSWKEWKAPEQETLRKTLFCSPQLVATFVRVQNSIRLAVAVCRPGVTAWWSVYVGLFSLFVDIAFHQEKLYICDNSHQQALFEINISVDQETGDPWISGIRQVITTRPEPMAVLSGEHVIRKMPYLVESNGGLLMVYRKIYCKKRRHDETDRIFAHRLVPTGLNEFEVFKADIQRSQWTKITTIGGDQVLFLRRRCCRSLCASQNGMPGNRIVFFENDEEDCDVYAKEDWSNSYRVYDMKDGVVATAPPMCSWKPGLVPATWLFPEVRV